MGSHPIDKWGVFWGIDNWGMFWCINKGVYFWGIDNRCVCVGLRVCMCMCVLERISVEVSFEEDAC